MQNKEQSRKQLVSFGTAVKNLPLYTAQDAGYLSTVYNQMMLAIDLAKQYTGEQINKAQVQIDMIKDFKSDLLYFAMNKDSRNGKTLNQIRVEEGGIGIPQSFTSERQIMYDRLITMLTTQEPPKKEAQARGREPSARGREPKITKSIQRSTTIDKRGISKDDKNKNKPSDLVVKAQKIQQEAKQQASQIQMKMPQLTSQVIPQQQQQQNQEELKEEIEGEDEQPTSPDLASQNTRLISDVIKVEEPAMTDFQFQLNITPSQFQNKSIVGNSNPVFNTKNFYNNSRNFQNQRRNFSGQIQQQKFDFTNLKIMNATIPVKQITNTGPTEEQQKKLGENRWTSAKALQEAYSQATQIAVAESLPGFGLKKSKASPIQSALNNALMLAAQQTAPGVFVQGAGALANTSVKDTLQAVLEGVKQLTKQPSQSYVLTTDSDGRYYVAFTFVTNGQNVAIPARGVKGVMLTVARAGQNIQTFREAALAKAKNKDFAKSKKYYGLPINQIKQIYKQVKSAYNALLRAEGESYKEFGLMKMGVNMLRKMVKSNLVVSQMNVNVANSLMDYAEAYSAEQTGKGIAMRKKIKAQQRKTAPKGEIDEERWKQLRLGFSKRTAAMASQNTKFKNFKAV